MLRLIAVFALVVVFAVTAPAQAQGPSTGSAVTPPGSRIGLMPLTGLMEAADFMGFADTQTGASVMFNELPPEAWVQMRDGMTAQALRQRGIQEMARSTFKTAAGDALLIEGVQGSGATSIGKYMMVFPGPGFTA
ncbi:MAG: hypothetical protein J0L57_04510, partial [Burkholderiales bacterium]|nr:hypothetical protein [Burkholderiales bacterium]